MYGDESGGYSVCVNEEAASGSPECQWENGLVRRSSANLRAGKQIRGRGAGSCPGVSAVGGQVQREAPGTPIGPVTTTEFLSVSFALRIKMVCDIKHKYSLLGSGS